ncbi:unnamed protein product [Sphacelaria rigidula]
MVNVVSRTCGDEGCSSRPSYGVAKSKNAEFCSQHARAGMVDVVTKKCGEEGCSKKPSYGVAGTKKAEFCSQHARAKMVNVVRKKCGAERCLKKPSYGAAGSKMAEFCSQHARAGMVDVLSRTCGDESCSKGPLYGGAGSKQAEFCSKHARAGMVDVVTRKCGDDRCSKMPSYGVAVSKMAEFCSKHAKAGRVHVMSYKSSIEARLKLDILNNDNLDKAIVCRQYPTAHEVARVYDMEHPSSEEATFTRTTSGGGEGSSSTADGGGGSVAGVRGTKRKRAPCLSSCTSNVIDTRRSVYPLAGRSGVTPLSLPGQLPSGTDREVSSMPRIQAGIKMEMTAPSPTHGGTGKGECSEHTDPLKGWSSAGGKSSSSSSSCGVSAGRLCGSPAVVCGSVGGSVGLESVETLGGSSVKLELGVASDR